MRILCSVINLMFVITLTSSCSNKNPTQDQTLDKTFVNLTEADGLPSNYVYALGSDENGNLWIARAGALDKLKQKSVWHVPPNQVEGVLQAVLIRT